MASAVDEVVEAVRSSAGRLSVRGGRGLCGLLPVPSAVASVVSTSGLVGVLDVAPADQTVTVEAGLSVAALASVLADYGQECPLDPWWPGATVGGVIASGMSGVRRLGLGPVRDYVLGVQVVLPTGEVVRAGGRTVKNVTGYDVCRLLVGSWGRLGVITEVTLRTRPRAGEARWYMDDVAGPAVARLAGRDGAVMRVEGRGAELDAWARRVGARPAPAGLVARLVGLPGRATARWSLPVPAASSVVASLPADVDWMLEQGVGLLHVAGPVEAGSLDGPGRVLHVGGTVEQFRAATAPADAGVDEAVARAFDPDARLDWRRW